MQLKDPRTELLSRLVLIIDGLVMSAFGLAFLIIPNEAASKLGILVTSPDAASDITATYGGLELGLASFLIFSAGQNRHVSSALQCAVFCLGGFTIGRLLGFFRSASYPNSLNLVFLALELLGFILSSTCYLWLANKQKRK